MAIYFNSLSGITSCPTSYSNYYSGNISDLTNPQVTYVECEAYLNELDISNLDLKLPVFIDTGSMGHAYFKVMSIDYENNNVTSKVLLQKICV